MLPFRLVIDTNILVSAALNPNGLQLEVLRLALAKPARLYVSRPILEEYAYVLSRQSCISGTDFVDNCCNS